MTAWIAVGLFVLANGLVLVDVGKVPFETEAECMAQVEVRRTELLTFSATAPNPIVMYGTSCKELTLIEPPPKPTIKAPSGKEVPLSNKPLQS